MNHGSRRRREARSSTQARRRRRGPIFVIGGREDLTGECSILEEFARHVGAGPLIVATVASEKPDELWGIYRPVFRRLGVRRLTHMPLESRQAVVEDGVSREELVRRARGVFFTGGSQLRITSILGGTALCAAIQDLNARGGALAGTSAGASVMSTTMLVEGSGDKSPRLGDVLRMAPGLGLLPDMIIDQHFAERGRIGRLLAAVAQNAKALGIGIDEDTAIVVEDPRSFRVTGAGAVYVIDGAAITRTNVVEGADDQTLSAHGLKVHLLTAGERFDLERREPVDLLEERARAASTPRRR